MNQRIFNYPVTVNAEKLGARFYDLICEQRKDHIVALGMLPADFMEALERMAREKIKADMPYLETKEQADVVKEIVRLTSVSIYKAAADAGKMRV